MKTFLVWRRALLLLPVLLLALLALACGGGEEKGAVKGTPTEEAEEGELFVDPNAPVVEVSLTEFKVEPRTDTGKAGGITFKASNDGAIEHALYVFKTDLPIDQLPVQDGKVPEDAAGAKFIGEIEELEAGKTIAATFDLAAGKYALICNITGHYEAGMFAGFTVK